MIPFAGLALLVCSMSVAGCGQGRESSSYPATSSDSASAVVGHDDLPIRLCLQVDRSRLEAIAQGDVRLWLQLRHRSASTRYSPAYTLSALDADGASAWRESFAMHVDHVEPATGAAQPQRFLFHLREAPIRIDDAGRVCFELDRADSDATAAVETPPVLEVELRWQDVASDR